MDNNKQQGHLGDETSATIALSDGRKLGYAQYGPTYGPTIICLHGLPGSRIDFARSDGPAKAAGARIIAVDRPGIGLSSPHPEATMLSHARDIESLATALDLDAYSVLGGSSGGPYSLACAYALPAEKLRAVAVICGLGRSDMGYEGIKWPNWIGYKYAGWVPSFAFRWFWKQDPGAYVHLSPEKHLELLRSYVTNAKPHEREVGLFDTEESIQLWLKTSRECFKYGVDAAVQDTYRLASDWGFRIEGIRKDLPVRLWYGNFDNVAPVNHGEQFAARLGANANLTVKDETHGSMFAIQPQAYLTDIVTCMKDAEYTRT